MGNRLASTSPNYRLPSQLQSVTGSELYFGEAIEREKPALQCRFLTLRLDLMMASPALYATVYHSV